jgi:hypothetical protein
MDGREDGAVGDTSTRRTCGKGANVKGGRPRIERGRTAGEKCAAGHRICARCGRREERFRRGMVNSKSDEGSGIEEMSE